MIGKWQRIQILERFKQIVDPIRREEISDKTTLANVSGLSWPTVNKLIDEVSNSKNRDDYPIFVEESYTINRYFSFHIGISIGATQIKVVCFDLNMDALKKSDYIALGMKDVFEELNRETENDCDFDSIENDEDIYFCYPQEQDLTAISERINNVISLFANEDQKNDRFNLLSIGISLPGIVNISTKRIEFCPNIKCLYGMDVHSLISRKNMSIIYGNDISLTFEHDSQAATIFEKENLYKTFKNKKKDKNNVEVVSEEQKERMIKLKDKPNFACVYFGAGIGLGVVNNNELCRGESNSFAEIGHVKVPNFVIKIDRNDKEILSDFLYYKFDDKKEERVKSSTICDCGKHSCLEVKFRRDVFNAIDNEDYIRKTSTKELNAFKCNHPYRYKVLRAYLDYIINLVINLYNPSVLVFSGRIISDINSIEEEMESIKLGSAIGLPASQCEIVGGSKKTYSAAGGAAIAAYMALHKEKNQKDYINISWK